MIRRLTRYAIVLLGLIVLLGTVPNPHIAHSQTGRLCFSETVFCIEGAIREFWERNGGLPVFGFPITRQQVQVVEGQELSVQWFQRNRLEVHPQGVLLGRLGVEALDQQERDWQVFPTGEADEGCRYFPETDHYVCGEVLAMWQANGLEMDGEPGFSDAESLALFGLPISALQPEELGDGKWYHVQWFERARFEIHPENEPPFNVLLGLLGSEVFCPNVPDPAHGGIRPGKCFNVGEVAEFDVFGFQAGERIEVRMMTEDADVVDRRTIFARDDGQYYRFLYETFGLYPALWRVEFSGASGHTATVHFRLLDGPPPPPPDAEMESRECPGVPEPENATVEPARCVAQGERLRMRVLGFQAGEQVNFQINAPDGGARQQEALASDDGSVPFSYSTVDLELGIWNIVATGSTSGHTATIYFEVRSP